MLNLNADLKHQQSYHSLIQSFFEFNDLPYCVEMNHVFLNEILIRHQSLHVPPSTLSNLVLFNTQLTGLLVNLHELREH